MQVKGLTLVPSGPVFTTGYFHSVAVGRASPTLGVKSFSIPLSAGATVTTDVEGDGTTPADPIETTLTTPNAGTVSVAELPRFGGVFDFSVAGYAVTITAPTATAANPLVIRQRTLTLVITA